MSGRKILIVSPTPTHPPIAGNRARIDVLVSAIRKLGHDVHFLHIQRESGDDAQMRAAWGENYSCTPYKLTRRRGDRYIRRLQSLFSPDARYTYSIDAWYDPALDDVVKRLMAEHRFDTVMVEYVFMSRVLQCFDEDVLKIIDTHDAFTNRHRLYLEKGQRPQWFSTTAKEEGKGFDRADVVIAIQDKEREQFSKITKSKVITLGHLVVQSVPAAPVLPQKRLLFVASDNAINVQGLEFFMDNVYPALKREFEDVEVAAAGTVCKAITDRPGLIKLGRVDDLSQAYANALAVINPVLFNTGLSIKNLEALGYSKPLVTAKVGVDGIEDGSGSAFLVAETADDFIRSVTQVLSDKSFADKLSRAAHDYAANWNRQAIAQLERALTVVN